METRIKTIVFAMVLIFSITQIKAQKVLISNPDEITAAAVSEFDLAMQAEGVLHKLKEKHQLKGNYIFDIIIKEKGQVVSVFVVENEGGTLDFQHLLKDEVLAMKLGFKMPKGKRYKFTYKFNF